MHSDLDSLSNLIDQLDSLLTRKGRIKRLPQGLSEAQITEQEELLGHRLPAEMRCFYGIHNGYFLDDLGEDRKIPFRHEPHRLFYAVDVSLDLKKLNRSLLHDLGMELDLWPDSLFCFGREQFPAMVDCAVPKGEASPILVMEETYTTYACTGSFAELVALWIRLIEDDRLSWDPESGLAEAATMPLPDYVSEGAAHLII